MEECPPVTIKLDSTFDIASEQVWLCDDRIYTVDEEKLIQNDSNGKREVFDQGLKILKLGVSNGYPWAVLNDAILVKHKGTKRFPLHILPATIRDIVVSQNFSAIYAQLNDRSIWIYSGRTWKQVSAPPKAEEP